MSEQRFPPADAADIAAYDCADVFAGFIECRAADPAPGPNRAPGYRWGWMNRLRDCARDDDGYDAVRRAYLRSIRP